MQWQLREIRLPEKQKDNIIHFVCQTVKIKFNYFNFPSNLQLLVISILLLILKCFFFSPSIQMPLNIIMKTDLRDFKARKNIKGALMIYE